MKKVMFLMVAVVLVLSLAVPALAVSSLIKKVEYEGNGEVEVEFASRVQYNDAKVTVKDSSGKTYTARITEKDSDDLEFIVSDIESGKTYTFTISGIRKNGEKSYTTVSGEFTANKNAHYDHDDD